MIDRRLQVFLLRTPYTEPAGSPSAGDMPGSDRQSTLPGVTNGAPSSGSRSGADQQSAPLSCLFGNISLTSATVCFQFSFTSPLGCDLSCTNTFRFQKTFALFPYMVYYITIGQDRDGQGEG